MPKIPETIRRNSILNFFIDTEQEFRTYARQLETWGKICSTVFEQLKPKDYSGKNIDSGIFVPNGEHSFYIIPGPLLQDSDTEKWGKDRCFVVTPHTIQVVEQIDPDHLHTLKQAKEEYRLKIWNRLSSELNLRNLSDAKEFGNFLQAIEDYTFSNLEAAFPNAPPFPLDQEPATF